MPHQFIVFRALVLVTAAGLSCGSALVDNAALATEIPVTTDVRAGSDAAIEEAQTLILAMMHEQLVPGVSVAVWRDELLWSAGFGRSDLETEVAVSPRTRFRIGSISKPLTVAALAKLIEQDKVDLDAPVRQYVPYWPRKSHTITSRQLAGHLAGIRHYVRDEFLIQREFPTVRQGTRIFRDDSLLDPPGEKYRYSSYGFNLLSAVVEGAAGEPFLSFVQQEVFDPLDMHQTVADHPAEVIEHRTRFYARRDGNVYNAPFVNNSYKWAGGGFLSTPTDLTRFAAAHLSERFLRPETIELLWTSQQTNDGKLTGYGIGWRVTADNQGRRVVGHGGGSVGGSCQLVVYPAERVIVVLTANMTGVRYNDLPYQIAARFIE